MELVGTADTAQLASSYQSLVEHLRGLPEEDRALSELAFVEQHGLTDAFEAYKSAHPGSDTSVTQFLQTSITGAGGHRITGTGVQISVMLSAEAKQSVALGEVDAVRFGELLTNIAPPSDTYTQRVAETPYKYPPDTTICAMGEPLDLDGLDPSATYTWVLDPAGRFLAPDTQEGFGITELCPQGRKVKHGDLCSTPDGMARAPARAGGELYALRDDDGTWTWAIDLNSSYAFQRVDGKVLKGTDIDRVIEYLEAAGTDASRLEGKNVFDPVRYALRKGRHRVNKLLEKLKISGRL